jgi:hypothetical protein
MDLHCPSCGEPWDFDTLHEEVSARKEDGQNDATYEKVAAEFRAKGCNALATSHGPQRHCTPDNNAPVRQAIYDLLGDDMDGAAAMLEDAENLGML